jgi:short-subunit dehydrogenase
VHIVGAGPGVGASVARRFARAGHPVGLIARNPRRLDDLARVLGAVFQHEAPVDLDPDALKVTPFSLGRRVVDRR